MRGVYGRRCSQSHDGSGCTADENTKDIEENQETRLWPNNPFWALVFLFMDITPVACFFPLFYVAQFLVVAILTKLGIDMNTPIPDEFYPHVSLVFLLSCGGALMSIPFCVLVIWFTLFEI